MAHPQTPLRHFLLVFDHRAGALVGDVREFDAVDDAVAAYEAAESQFDQASDEVEVVLIGSDSLETVRQTHANYFDGTAALARALAKILQAAGELAVNLSEQRSGGTKDA